MSSTLRFCAGVAGVSAANRRHVLQIAVSNAQKRQMNYRIDIYLTYFANQRF